MCKRLSFLLKTILLSFPCKPGQISNAFACQSFLISSLNPIKVAFNAQDCCGNMEIWEIFYQ